MRSSAQNKAMNALFLHLLVEDLLACLSFYSRLSLPTTSSGMPAFSRALRALPLAGAIIGGCGGLALLFARVFGVPALPAAVCAIAALVAVTGGLHEDGLADVADGFGGGATRQRKLEIMRDSRLGSYGAIALTLALMLRVSALATLTERGLGIALAALVCSAAASRTAGLAPLLLSTPARVEGAGAAMERPSSSTLMVASLFVVAASIPFILAGGRLSQVVVADIGALLAAGLVARLADRQIGGFTGDVLGAAQQVAEIVILLALCSV